MGQLPCPLRERTLCVWCRENVFDQHTLKLIDRHNATKFNGGSKSSNGDSRLWDTDKPFNDCLGPFREGVDALAYFTNRSSGPTFLRTYTRDALFLTEGMAERCVFCYLLNSIIYQEPPSDNRGDKVTVLLSDIVNRISLSGDGPVKFQFTICIQYPWQASSVALEKADGKAVGNNFYFQSTQWILALFR